MEARRQYFARRGVRCVLVWYKDLRCPTKVKTRVLAALRRMKTNLIVAKTGWKEAIPA